MKEEIINIRIEADIKKKVKKLLANQGLTISQACRLFLIKVRKDKSIKFLLD